ncbi:MAG: MarR family transcriptional regulator, partial [Chloroflexi bacterium]|nr:MarR family transcriptional regulator [Chloroflexota bacterium]
MPNARREELIVAVIAASQESSTTAVFFHTAIAERVGLGATDEKTLFILSGAGRLTAGEIAQHTGLTTASVTSLIDRLERKGFVQRVRDAKDRRKIYVELNEAKLAELTQFFDSFQGRFGELLDAYSDEQLAAIADFLTRAAQMSRAVVA